MILQRHGVATGMNGSVSVPARRFGAVLDFPSPVRKGNRDSDPPRPQIHSPQLGRGVTKQLQPNKVRLVSGSILWRQHMLFADTPTRGVWFFLPILATQPVPHGFSLYAVPNISHLLRR